MKLAKIIESMNAAAPLLNPALTERDIATFAIDSRDVNAGDLFFALSQPEYAANGFNGDFEDATRFVPDAFAAGAVAAVVRADRLNERTAELAPFRERLIVSKDVIKSLQTLAYSVYLEWNGPVIAITGSAGKTTAKELTAHVLSASGRRVLRNIKNYNNGLGHPITVLTLARDKSFDAAVLEMGMSTPLNEIARLCKITPPDVAVELNVLPVHLEHLGTIENIAKAKAELIEGMKPGGTAVLNADDARVLAMKAVARGTVLTFGIDGKADVCATNIGYLRFGETKFDLITPKGNAPVTFALDGRHNVLNALAAAAVGHTFGMSAAQIADALSSAQAAPQRGEIISYSGGFTLINDSYNSNPDALLSMVETLRNGSGNARRRIVVAGEMLELGPESRAIHQEVGQKLASIGIDVLIGVRGHARELVDGAIAGGIGNAIFVENSQAAGAALSNIVEAGDAILIKGSRGVKTEQVIEALDARFARSTAAAAV